MNAQPGPLASVRQARIMTSMQISPDVLIWMTIGIALLSSEAFTGTFHLLFFGLSALLTAVVASIGVSNSTVQVIVFSVVSIASVILLRKRLVARSRGFDGDLHSKITLSADIAPGDEATIQYQGVPWTAVNTSALPLLRGDRARVLRTEGIKLILEPDPTSESSKN